MIENLVFRLLTSLQLLKEKQINTYFGTFSIDSDMLLFVRLPLELNTYLPTFFICSDSFAK